VAIAAFTANSATTPASIAPAALSSDEPLLTSAVEDFAYPNADLIQQQKKILLKRGDGNIVLVPCDGITDILIKNRVSPTLAFCFDVKAKPGYLSLELPDSFGIFTETYPVKATISANGEETVINAQANAYVPFGESIDGTRSVLVELRVTG
jgi:hypothetical protein